jgi:hypothetical protein
LERIYRSHYYTPAPDGIAVQFRNDFLLMLEKFGLVSPRQVLLEIGASDGDVLAELRTRTSAAHAYAFEPNKENAAIATRRGLDVRECFFGGDVTKEELEPADLIYARHVIEHIFEFEDFFAGLNATATPAADFILETPSLDFHAGKSSTAPFHIEHVHVFSLRSLATLSLAHGWRLTDAEVTVDGNLIAAFKRTSAFDRVDAGVKVPPPILDGIQQAVDRRRTRLRKLLVDRQLVFWGAGSAGVGLVSTIGREPDIWTDGNPNKVGKKFVGLNCEIVSPETAFSQVRFKGFNNPVLVIASSFAREILPRIGQLGWESEVFDLAGNLLQDKRRL